MKKTASIQMQFSWIFILIAGGAILLFFVSIIHSQKTASETNIASKLATDLDSIMVGSSVSTKSSHIFDVPKVDVNLDCHTIKINNVEKQLSDMFAFGLLNIRGNKFITWSYDWNVPFRVTNVLYMASDQIRFIVVYKNTTDIDNGEILFSQLPDSMTKTLVPISRLSSLKNLNNYKIQVICFDNCDLSKLPSFLKNFDTTIIKVEKIEEFNDNFGYGTLDYYSIKNNAFDSIGTSHYFGDAMFYGGIFSDDVSVYDCIVDRMFERLKYVSDIYVERTKTLQSYYSTQPNSECSIHYQISTVSVLDTISKSKPSSMDTLVIASNSLINENGVARLYSCPLIY